MRSIVNRLDNLLKSPQIVEKLTSGLFYSDITSVCLVMVISVDGECVTKVYDSP